MKKKVIPFCCVCLFVFFAACSTNFSVSSSKAGSTVPSSSVVLSSAQSSAVSSAASKSTKENGSADSLPTKDNSANTDSSNNNAPNTEITQKDEKPDTVKITIPEGFALPQIAARLEANGVCAAADFIQATQTYDFSYYPLVAKITENPNRCYKLEGYLYPDTYEFYIDMKPQDAVGKFLRNAEKQIGDNYTYTGLSTDELITLASIIEREADDPENMRKVSSVFHNRLKIGMILQADSTRDYCNTYLVPQFGDKYNAYYNTYPNRSPGLPVGPISNPGKDALYAAAHPADTDYLYFATGTDHQYYYGTTEQDRDALMANAGVTPLYAD